MAAFDPATLDRWRALAIVDRDGVTVGTISEFYLDRETGYPTWALVNTGLFGATQTFVPLVHATEIADGLQVPYAKSHIKDTPRIDLHDELTPDEEATLFAHYGVDYHPAPQAAAGTGPAGEGPGPVGGEGATNLEGPGSVAAQGPGPAAAEDAGPTGAQGSGPVPAEGPGPVPAGSPDTVSGEQRAAEGPGPVPAAEPAVVPGEGPGRVAAAGPWSGSTTAAASEPRSAESTAPAPPEPGTLEGPSPGGAQDGTVEGPGPVPGEPGTLDDPGDVPAGAGQPGPAGTRSGPVPVRAGLSEATESRHGPGSGLADPVPGGSGTDGPDDATLVAPAGSGSAAEDHQGPPNPDRPPPVPDHPGSYPSRTSPADLDEPPRPPAEAGWAPDAAGSFEEAEPVDRPAGSGDRWHEAKLGDERDRIARSAAAQPEERSPLERARRRLERLVGVGQEHEPEGPSPADRDAAERARRARLGLNDDDPDPR